MKYYLFPHHTSLNRGCEALIVTISNFISETNNSSYIIHDNMDDDLNLISKKAEIKFITPTNKIKRFSKNWLLFQIYSKIKKDTISFFKLLVKDSYKNCLDGDIYVSIGGDNYCYNKPLHFYAINRLLKEHGKKTIFLGCSIEPKLIDSDMINDLSSFDLIIARESLTYNALIKSKIKTNIQLLPDPAFTLKSIKLPLPNGFKPNDTIGINISPLIIESEKIDGITLANYEELICHIIDTSRSSIALIPHVTYKTTDDRIPLKLLFDKFKHTNRVILFDEYNCQELKGFISQCKIFVGARTHATIAAYSSCVPTLVVGYSIKAKGIATDLFGLYDNYILSVQSLTKSDELKNSYKWILENENNIRTQLKEVMSNYIVKAESIKTTILNINNPS